MFQRIVKLLEARRALRLRRWEDALSLADDPTIRDHKKAIEVREAALDGLLTRARERMRDGDLEGAYLDVRSVVATARNHPGVQALWSELQGALQREERQLAGETPLEDSRQERAPDVRRDVERIEELADRRDYSGAWHELQAIENAGPFRTRIFDLRKRVQRELGLGKRFFLRVEESGEYLVLTGDVIRIGNARAPGNDLPILANISSHHLEIHRRVSFHQGVTYVLQPLTGKPIYLDGKRIHAPTPLREDARLRLGDSLEIDFSRPSDRSHSAVLRLRKGFEVQGVDRIILLKPGAKDGRILVGPHEAAHIPAQLDGTLELYTDPAGELRCIGELPLLVDGHPVEASEPVLPGGCWVQCRGLGFAVDPG